MTFEKRLSQERVRQLEEEFPRAFPPPLTWEQQSLRERIRRSLSWLERAALASQDDKPPRFVELWIGLNALYGCRNYERRSKANERKDFKNFMRKLKRLDRKAEVLVPLMKQKWIEYNSLLLIGNKYLWNEFWKKETDKFKKKSAADRKAAAIALRENDTTTFFYLLFVRLLVLRNQIMHGSSSATTKKSEDALKPSLLLLEEILPEFICLMMRQ
jgi:hypothetical protein